MRFLILPTCVALLAECAQAEPPALDYQVRTTLPHDSSYFTQGLLFYQGNLYESTGLYGQSQLIRYAEDRQTPRIRRHLDAGLFGEGIAVLDDRLYLLTWQAGLAQIYDPSAFSLLGNFTYDGEGWGLTSDGHYLWMSNGSADLVQRDGEGTELARVTVSLDGEPLDRLNELEYVDGWILANRWFDTQIYLIDPRSGLVGATLDLSDLSLDQLALSADNVLNGMAWDPASATLWITGKRWNQLYQLELDLPELPNP